MGELMVGEPENCLPLGIDTVSGLSEKGEYTPGASDEMADKRGSSVRGSAGCLSWEPSRRNSSSRLA